MSVVNLHKEREEMIFQLEQLLESVKKGETTEVCFVWRDSSGKVDHDFLGIVKDPSQVIGELEVLKMNYMTIYHQQILHPFLGE